MTIMNLRMLRIILIYMAYIMKKYFTNGETFIGRLPFQKTNMILTTI